MFRSIFNNNMFNEQYEKEKLNNLSEKEHYIEIALTKKHETIAT